MVRLQQDEPMRFGAILTQRRTDLSGVSVLGRFNFLIVDSITLFVGFISLFGRLGNFLSNVIEYQQLTGTISRPQWPGIDVFPVFSRRSANPISANLRAEIRRQFLVRRRISRNKSPEEDRQETVIGSDDGRPVELGRALSPT
jgi:hypothetical protein